MLNELSAISLTHLGRTSKADTQIHFRLYFRYLLPEDVSQARWLTETYCRNAICSQNVQTKMV